MWEGVGPYKGVDFANFDRKDQDLRSLRMGHRQVYNVRPTWDSMDRRTRNRLYARCRRWGIWWRTKPCLDLMDTPFNEVLLKHLQRGREGLQVLPTGGVRALLVDGRLNPIGLRVMRDLRVCTDRSSFDAFVDSARGRVDGKRRFTGRLLRLNVELWDRGSGLAEHTIVAIIEESKL